MNLKNIARASVAALLLVSMAACTDVDYEKSPVVPGAGNVAAQVSGRSVTLSWTLPKGDIKEVMLLRNADFNSAIILPANATSYTYKVQPMAEPLVYTVKVRYTDGLLSEGVSAQVTIPTIESKACYLLTAASPAQLPDDDEQRAAQWFQDNYVATGKGKFVAPAEIKDIDPDYFPVLWIEIDRVGIGLGWERLPAEVVAPEVIQAMKDYSANGGSFYLANHATQLTVPLGIVPADMPPTVFGDGNGGSGNDVWVANAILGVDFNPDTNPGAEQGYYDRTGHEIFKGITFEDPNGYGYLNLPLIGPGQREDHNCMWDCNIYGKGTQKDVIRNFEVMTSSMVLATWGHVRDHCVAALVDFYATSKHGRCVANGLAAYEWNQNSGENIYQHNVEKLTSNILSYLM